MACCSTLTALAGVPATGSINTMWVASIRLVPDAACSSDNMITRARCWLCHTQTDNTVKTPHSYFQFLFIFSFYFIAVMFQAGHQTNLRIAAGPLCFLWPDLQQWRLSTRRHSKHGWQLHCFLSQHVNPKTVITLSSNHKSSKHAEWRLKFLYCRKAGCIFSWNLCSFTLNKYHSVQLKRHNLQLRCVYNGLWCWPQ